MDDRKDAMPIIQEVVGRNLRTVRAHRGMTWGEVAAKARLASPETVGRYERGQGNPDLATIAALAFALDVDPIYLLSDLKIPRRSEALEAPNG